MDTECTTTYKLKNQIGLLEIHSWWVIAVLQFIKQDKCPASCWQLQIFFLIQHTCVITVMVTSELICLWFLRSFLTWASVWSMLFFCKHPEIEVLGVVAFILIGVWTHQSRLDQAYWPDAATINLRWNDTGQAVWLCISVTM